MAQYLIDTLDHSFTERFGVEYSSIKIKDGRKGPSTDLNTIQRANIMTNNAVAYHNNGDTQIMNLNQLKAYLALLHEATGRQNVININSANLESKKIIDQNALYKLREARGKAQRRWNELELKKEYNEASTSVIKIGKPQRPLSAKFLKFIQDKHKTTQTDYYKLSNGERLALQNEYKKILENPPQIGRASCRERV